jgi:hypothetical protein
MKWEGTTRGMLAGHSIRDAMEVYILKKPDLNESRRDGRPGAGRRPTQARQSLDLIADIPFQHQVKLPPSTTAPP